MTAPGGCGILVQSKATRRPHKPVKPTTRINREHKRGNRLLAPERRRPRRHWGLRWAALGLGSVVLGVVMAKTQEVGPAPPDASAVPPTAEMQRVSLSLPSTSTPNPTVGPSADTATLEWRSVTVESGDSFARLLGEHDIGYPVIHALANAGDAGKRLGQLRPGDRLRLGFAPDSGALQRVIHQRSVDRRTVFERNGDGPSFSGRVVEAQLERRLQHAHAEIETSLFQAAAEADMPDRLIMELVNIFRWDIDFVYNIRRGDRFTVVYETFHKNGERVSTGDVVAAEFINQGQVHRAARYTDPEGNTDYYAPDGTSMRKAFLRTPVEFTRISSRFGKRRHPISHKIRNHTGVDYAARSGTPIHSTGDGRIVFRGRNGGYGNMIVIEHAGRYSTAYAHMSRFAGGLGVGSRVEQGQTIGYVGSTGYSTGPHLHYEFRVDGQHRNPLAIEFPSVEPVADEHRDHFEQQVAPQLAQLDTLHRAYAELD